MDPEAFLELLSPCQSNPSDDPWPSPDPPLSLPLADFPQLPPLGLLDNNKPYTSVLKLSNVASALHAFSSSSPIPSSLPFVLKRPLEHPFTQPMRVSVPLEENDQKVNVTSVSADPPLPITGPCSSHKPCGSFKRAKLQCSGQEGASLPETNLKAVSKDVLTQREAHIYSERQRRKTMKDSFSTLQSLVPKLKLKHTDRVTVLTEVITYIRSLRGTLEELERKRSDIMALLGLSEGCDHVHGNSSSVAQDETESMVEVSVRICGSDVFITLNIPKRRGLWSAVLMFLQKNSVDVVNATMATSEGSNFHCIHGKATNITRLERTDVQGELKDLIMMELKQRRLKFYSGVNQILATVE